MRVPGHTGLSHSGILFHGPRSFSDSETAADDGFDCTVIGDVCATRALEFDESAIPAAQVPLSTLATLDRYYGRVISTEKSLDSLKQ